MQREWYNVFIIFDVVGWPLRIFEIKIINLAGLLTGNFSILEL
jgi:hypothetical protein